MVMLTFRCTAFPKRLWPALREGYDLIAALAFLPWFFSCKGFDRLGAGLFIFGTLRISLSPSAADTPRLLLPALVGTSLALLGGSRTMQKSSTTSVARRVRAERGRNAVDVSDNRVDL